MLLLTFSRNQFFTIILPSGQGSTEMRKNTEANMTRFIAQSLIDRLEREWRVIDPERRSAIASLPRDENAVPTRRLRMGRFDDAELDRD